MADESAKRPLWIKIAVIAGIILVVDVVAGFLIFKYAIPMVYKTEQTKAEEKKEKKKGKDGKELETPLLQKSLEAININPAQSSGEILSTEIVLETREQAAIDEFTAREAEMRDLIMTYLSYKDVASLNDISKRELYKKEILTKINALLKNGKFTGFYTKSWIIQFP